MMRLPSLHFVIVEWPRLQTKWEAWANAVTDSDLAREVPFKSRFVGNAALPARQIVMHVVNHATLHRGQIVGMPRQQHEAARRRTLVLLLRTSRACHQLAIRRTPQMRRSGKRR
jgi:uncharacterized damage-inducible protein DinB